jgi:hypothetical protein
MGFSLPFNHLFRTTIHPKLFGRSYYFTLPSDAIDPVAQTGFQHDFIASDCLPLFSPADLLWCVSISIMAFRPLSFSISCFI